jgi:hypothetical protein
MSFIPAVLCQRDPRWKDEKLGFDNSVSIGTDGCTLTCLAMLVNGYGFNETPSSMNKKFKDMGDGNAFLGGLIVWGGLTRAFPRIVFRNIIICRDQAAPIMPSTPRSIPANRSSSKWTAPPAPACKTTGWCSPPARATIT